MGESWEVWSTSITRYQRYYNTASRWWNIYWMVMCFSIKTKYIKKNVTKPCPTPCSASNPLAWQQIEWQIWHRHLMQDVFKTVFPHAPSVTSSLLPSSLLRQLGLFDVLARKATPRRPRILACTWKTDVSILVFLTLCISSLFCVCKLNSTYQIILFLQHLERWEAMIRSTYFLTQDFEKWIRSCH